MARIAGIDLPRNKRVEIGLMYIYGIGRSRSVEILTTAGVDPDTRVKDLVECEVARIREVIDREHGPTPERARGPKRRWLAAAGGAGPRKSSSVRCMWPMACGMVRGRWN